MKKVYYAHTKFIYGKPAEHTELKYIRRKFRTFRIVNPARYEGHPEKLRDTMGFCLRLVEKCDAIIFSESVRDSVGSAGTRSDIAIQRYFMRSVSISRCNRNSCDMQTFERP